MAPLQPQRRRLARVLHVAADRIDRTPAERRASQADERRRRQEFSLKMYRASFMRPCPPSGGGLTPEAWRRAADIFDPPCVACDAPSVAAVRGIPTCAGCSEVVEDAAAAYKAWRGERMAAP